MADPDSTAAAARSADPPAAVPAPAWDAAGPPKGASAWSSADDRLAVRDPSLPGLRRALDPTAVADACTALLGLPVTGVQAVYARYKTQTSLAAVHRLQTPDGPVLVAAKAHGPGQDAKLGKHLARAHQRHGHAHAADAGAGVLLRRWPADTGMPSTADLDRAPDQPHGVVPAPDWVQRAMGMPLHLQPLRWKPARRLVMALRDPDGEVQGTLKVLQRVDRARNGAAAMGLLAGHDGGAAIALRWVPGTPLDVVLSHTADLEDARRLGWQAGAALARLHQMRAAGIARLPDPVGGLRRATAGASLLLPGLAPGIRSLTATVADSLPRHGTALLHGDAAADQLVVGPDGRITPIDVDDLGVGAPALDLGSVLAALQVQVVTAGLSASVADAAAQGILVGHRDAGGRCRPDHLAAAQAAGLLRRLGDPFKQRDPQWDDAAATLLEAAALVVVGTASLVGTSA